MIVLYTPVYYTSPGTQARVDLLKKSLETSGYNVILAYDRNQDSMLRKIYNVLGEKLLTLESTWKVIGMLIARNIYKYRPKTAILLLDTSASAIPYLKRYGINTILSIEDLTPEYKSYDLQTSKKYYQLLLKYAEQADAIISPSYTLSKRLEEIGLKATTIPIGLEPSISLDEALSRQYPYVILHAGQLNTQRKIEVILDLASRYKLMVHNFGDLADKLYHPNIEKYREERLNINTVKDAHMGLVLEYRKAYTLTRLYFHVSLLQPIIADGFGPWVEEANCLGININPLDSIEEIIENYEKYVKSMVSIQTKFSVPHIYKPLLNMLYD
jgi:glycosyltransferase involved in cell wall biosynthesis